MPFLAVEQECESRHRRRSVLLLWAAAVITACGQSSSPAESAVDSALYEVVREDQASSMLKLDWNGGARELTSGREISLAGADARRMVFVSLSLIPKGPMLWRSTLDWKLKTGELSSKGVATELLERPKLVRAYLPNEKYEGEYFFRQGVSSDLDASHYVAHCSTPFSWEEKARIHCSTNILVDSLAVEIRFDKAFLWDFDSLQARVEEAVRSYIATPHTQQLIRDIPKFDWPKR